MIIFSAESGRAQMQTLITEHFRVHFMPGAEGTARRVAETAKSFPHAGGRLQLLRRFSHDPRFSARHIRPVGQRLGGLLQQHYGRLGCESRYGTARHPRLD